MFSLGPAGEFLCCALADDPQWQERDLWRLYEAIGESAAWQFAKQNRAESIAGLALRRVAASDRLPSRWLQAIDETERQVGQFMKQLDRVAAALEAEEIRLVALKNSGIARGIFTELAGSPMGDVDVLIDRRDFQRAHRCLLSLGYQLNSRSPLGESNLEEAERSGGSEYQVQLGDGTMMWFELQWRPVAGRWIRPEQEPQASELLAGSTAVPGTAVRLLGPEDNLLQVCLHTAKHSYVRAPGFRLHTDVDRIVRRCRIDWDQFAQNVERLQVQTAVYFSLAMPSQLLRTPVPSTVLARLHPPSWKERLIWGSLRRAGLFDPDAHKWSKLGYIVFNLLLYDSAAEVIRAVFPTYGAMQSRYGLKTRWMLPWWYLVRIFELLMKRAQT
jgi:hypothetical protein